MLKEKELIKFIVALTRGTIEGKIEWNSITPPTDIISATDSHINIVYSTIIKGKNFIVYEEKYKAYSGEFDELYWTSSGKIALLDDQKVVWNNTIKINEITDLLDVIKEKDSEIGTLVSDILESMDG